MERRKRNPLEGGLKYATSDGFGLRPLCAFTPLLVVHVFLIFYGRAQVERCRKNHEETTEKKKTSKLNRTENK